MDCIELAVSYTFLYVNAGDNRPCREILSIWDSKVCQGQVVAQNCGRVSA